jgi:hypothetical protein
LLGAEADSLRKQERKGIPRQVLHLPGPDYFDRAFIPGDRHQRVLHNLARLSKERVQRIALAYPVPYEHGVRVGDFDGDGKADLAVFGYTKTGVGAGGPPAVYVWLQ